MGELVANIVIILIVLILVGAACYYIYREKKRGRRCIGCPMAGQCEQARAKMHKEFMEYKQSMECCCSDRGSNN